MRGHLIVSLCLLGCFSLRSHAATIAVDTSGVRPGPVAVVASPQSLDVSWRDSSEHQWRGAFFLDAAEALFSAVSGAGKKIGEFDRPFFRCTTGKRSGGWDAFFDFPPENPAGTRRFMQEFHPTTVTARTAGDRVEGPFIGSK